VQRVGESSGRTHTYTHIHGDDGRGALLSPSHSPSLSRGLHPGSSPRRYIPADTYIPVYFLRVAYNIRPSAVAVDSSLLAANFTSRPCSHARIHTYTYIEAHTGARTKHQQPPSPRPRERRSRSRAAPDTHPDRTRPRGRERARVTVASIYTAAAPISRRRLFLANHVDTEESFPFLPHCAPPLSFPFLPSFVTRARVCMRTLHARHRRLAAHTHARYTRARARACVYIRRFPARKQKRDRTRRDATRQRDTNCGWISRDVFPRPFRSTGKPPRSRRPFRTPLRTRAHPQTTHTRKRDTARPRIASL